MYIYQNAKVHEKRCELGIPEVDLDEKRSSQGGPLRIKVDIQKVMFAVKNMRVL